MLAIKRIIRAAGGFPVLFQSGVGAGWVAP